MNDMEHTVNVETQLSLIAFNLILQNTVNIQTLYDANEDAEKLALIVQAYINGVLDMESAVARSQRREDDE